MKRVRQILVLATLLLIKISSVLCAEAVGANHTFALQTNDVVVFLGGGNTVAAQEAGYLESFLSARFRGLNVRYRNMAWEGDTVYAQPRDLNFPALTNQLQRVGATVVIIEYGQTEALEGKAALPRFAENYERLLDNFARYASRFVLVVPPPFSKGVGALTPDLSMRNTDLAEFARTIRDLARRRSAAVIDLFEAFAGGRAADRLTGDSTYLTATGQFLVAQAIARQLGLGEIVDRAGTVNEKGQWTNAAFERLRQAIIAKNRLWFNYWRPMNWAFLAGDRTEQPSSRDHRDPKVRWFPSEIEKFTPLIKEAEAKIEHLADSLVSK